MKKYTFLAAGITLIATVTGRVWGLELGGLTVYSDLGEPFYAEITLQGADGTLEEELYVGLASANEFANAGMARTPYLVGISFVVEIAHGASRVLLKSQAPLREPDLQFVVEARWPEGRLLRDYTILVDFPSQTPREPLPSNEQSLEESASFLGDPDDVASVNRQFGRAVSDRPSPGGRYLVTSSDTLWSIASSVAGPGVSVEQTMLEIVATNPHAFLDGNVNRLESGYVLELPAEGEVQVELGGALDTVAKQNAVWAESTKNGRQGLTLAAKSQPIEVEETRGGDAAEQLMLLEADLISDGLPLEQESSVVASSQTEVGRSELDALTSTVEELQGVVAQLQSQLTERDLQLAELRAVFSARDAVFSAAPTEQSTFRTRLLDFLSEPVWLFVTVCVAIVSALLTHAALRRRQDLGSQSGNGHSVVFAGATGSDDDSSPGPGPKQDTFTEEGGRSMGTAGLSEEGISSSDEPSAGTSTLSLQSEAPTEAAGADTTSSVDSIYGAETDPIDSKLDLARAYIDMGDDDGARPVLHEVIKQGDHSQQAEAIELLRRIEAP